MAKANKGTATPKTPKAAVSFLKLPAPVTKPLPLDSLTFDKSLQHRSKLVNEDTVTEYAALQAAGTVFPALKAVHQTTDENGEKCNVYWVYDGFQRGAAFKKNNVEKYPVEVIDGDYETAYFLSLSSNRDHGLNRTAEDKKRAVFALLDNPRALELCLSKAKGNGGAHRVMAAAVGCSAAWVDEALKERGLSAKGDQLVKRRKPTETPDPPKPATIVAPVVPTPAEPATPADPDAERKANDAAYKAMCETVFIDRVNEAASRAKRIAVLISTLITDKEHGHLVRDVMKAQGLSVSDEFDVRMKKEGDGFSPYHEVLELWPVSNKLGALFAGILRAHAAKTAPKAEAEPTPTADPAAEQAEPTATPEPSTNGATPKKAGKKPKKAKEPAATE